MNGLQTLINQWTRIDSVGDLTLYSNDTIALPSFIVIDPTPAIISLEVFRALGYQPPFTDQATAMAAMEQLAAMGGSSAIPGILAMGAATPPPIAVAPLAPVAIDPPIVPVPTGVAGFGLAPEPPIAVAPVAIDPTDTSPLEPIDAQASVDRMMAQLAQDIPDLIEPMIVTPIAAPIYPTAQDHTGLPHSSALAKLDDLVKLLALINPVAEDLRQSIANLVVNSISGQVETVTADPDSRSMPSIARSSNAEGDKWYLMIGPLTSLTEEQAIEQQTNLLKAAKFTRTPKLNAPTDNDIEGFGEVWYNPISYSQAERLSWMDGTKLPVHNM